MKAAFLLTFLIGMVLATGAQSPSRIETVPLPQAQNFALPAIGASALQQASVWQTETQSNPANANAWLNYAVWTQRNTALTPEQKQLQLTQISNESQPYISGSGEWQLIRFLQSNKTDSAAITLALEKITDKTQVYPFAIQSAIIRQNKKELKNYCTAYAKILAPDVDLSYSSYHGNVLRSAPDSAVIAAMGENDLVPMAIQQQVNGIRPDVRLVYYQPSVALQYKKLFLCLTLGENILSAYRQNASFRGLLLDVSGEKNTTNPEELFIPIVNMNYMKMGVFTGTLAQLHNNYLPSLILAYRYYKKINSETAERYKKLIEKIAREGGKENVISAALNK